MSKIIKAYKILQRSFPVENPDQAKYEMMEN